MNTKERFMQAVRILAPGDQFILQAARQVPAETLPLAPGGAALEFVAAMEKAKRSETFPSNLPQPFVLKKQRRTELRGVTENISVPEFQNSPRAQTVAHKLPLKDALRVKSAEFWLKLSQPVQALQELNQLPNRARKHPWALRVFLSALRQAWDLNQYPAHAE